MLSSRLNAFETPISQSDGDRVAEDRVVDELDVRAGREHDRRRRALGGELRERAEAEEVVGEPGGEHERRPLP